MAIERLRNGKVVDHWRSETRGSTRRNVNRLMVADRLVFIVGVERCARNILSVLESITASFRTMWCCHMRELFGIM